MDIIGLHSRQTRREIGSRLRPDRSVVDMRVKPRLDQPHQGQFLQESIVEVKRATSILHDTAGAWLSISVLLHEFVSKKWRLTVSSRPVSKGIFLSFSRCWTRNLCYSIRLCIAVLKICIFVKDIALFPGMVPAWIAELFQLRFPCTNGHRFFTDNKIQSTSLRNQSRKCAGLSLSLPCPWWMPSSHTLPKFIVF